MIDHLGRVLPDFIIVGSMRAGSTYLRQMLSRHPRVHVFEKEVNFFGGRRNWARGTEWYARHFEDTPADAVVGEKCVAYSYRPAARPTVPQRIAKLLPDVKLIWTLRDPVERTYSQYWHAVRNGHERLSFERALESRAAPDWRAYRDRSVYVNQVRSFLEVFPRERIHFIEFGALTRRPADTLAGVFSFIGVDPSAAPVDADAADARHNRGSRPRSLALSRALSRAPARLRRLIRRGMKTREALVAFFEPYNAELEALIGVDTAGWGSSPSRT
jgi:hypothetical protein